MEVVGSYNYSYTQNQNAIKDVAIYLRKSRGEEEDLEKHRMALVDMCKIKGWRYTEYSEVGTADSLVFRPQMRKLLSDIENELFDAVVVIDMDRLSRGDGEEQAKIKNIIRRSGTYIVTPQKMYDLNNESDDMYSDFEGLMARVEYKQIKKRFRRGKRQGARRGDWTNGTPPFPYVYQQWHDEKTGEMHINEKGLVVNREKYEIYRFMIDKVLLERITPNNIAWELNRRGIPSPRGGRWYGVTVQRILVDETHLGKIISNKTSGDGHKIKKSKDSKDVVYHPREEWIIVENCHEAVKTQEEHDKLLLFFARETKAPKRTATKISPLSGLLKCKKCSHTIQTLYRSDRKGEEYIKPCWYRDELGNKCKNKGAKADIVHKAIREQLALYEQELRIALQQDGDIDSDKSILREINMTLKELTRLEKKICKIDELVEDEYYTPQEARKRKETLKVKIDETETRLNLLQIKLNNSEKTTNQERLTIIERFKKAVAQENLTADELNEWYKSIISHIVWEKTEDELLIDVNFL
ncbi:TPA: recombinase family protein [Clostridium botulinum]|uniref:recombinase family protein n=1 Tax=Clostridium botulinum TaxID=1491 RepID=UPI001C9B26A0|nr:recombinase family protein [Clostridium botulinum]MBY6909573.1 recombinase family protein [Clostridium botulinum]